MDEALPVPLDLGHLQIEVFTGDLLRLALPCECGDYLHQAKHRAGPRIFTGEQFMNVVAATLAVVAFHPSGSIQVEERHRRSRTSSSEAGMPAPRTGSTAGSRANGVLGT